MASAVSLVCIAGDTTRLTQALTSPDSVSGLNNRLFIYQSEGMRYCCIDVIPVIQVPVPPTQGDSSPCAHHDMH